MPALYKKTSSALLLVFSLFIGIFLSLSFYQYKLIHDNKIEIEYNSKLLIENSDKVVDEINIALINASSFKKEICTKSDIDSMRSMLLTYSFIKDIGRIENGEVACSALWGSEQDSYILNGSPYVIKENSNGVGDKKIWSGMKTRSRDYSYVDLSVVGNSFVVTATDVFIPHSILNKDLNFLITSKNESLIMNTIGKINEGFSFDFPLNKTTCSERFDFCIKIQNNSSMLKKENAGIIFLISIIGSISGGCVWYYMIKKSRKSMMLESKLSSAIHSKSIYLEYQPIIEASTGKVNGIEALARWHDKDLGEISPAIFISKANEINLLRMLTINIVHRGFSECHHRLKMNPKLYLSFNIDSNHLADDFIIKELIRLVDFYTLHPGQIAIEILEVSTLEIYKLKSIINTLQQNGFLVFIDDFGTGYSSLAYLSQLKFDRIKIAKEFTQSAGTGSRAESILNKICEIAIGIQTIVIFEGVETKEQEEAILKINPDANVQGWLYSKAVAINEVCEYYK